MSWPFPSVDSVAIGSYAYILLLLCLRQSPTYDGAPDGLELSLASDVVLSCLCHRVPIVR